MRRRFPYTLRLRTDLRVRKRNVNGFFFERSSRKRNVNGFFFEKHLRKRNVNGMFFKKDLRKRNWYGTFLKTGARVRIRRRNVCVWFLANLYKTTNHLKP